MTNAEFAKKNRVFKKACEIAEIEATRRQASKYRRKRGMAWQNHVEAKIIIKEKS